MLYTMIGRGRWQTILANCRALGMWDESIAADALEVITGEIEDESEAAQWVCDQPEWQVAKLMVESYRDAFSEEGE